MTGFSVAPLAGADVLQRSGDIVVLVSTAADDVAVDAVLDLARTAANDGVDGRKLVRRLARFLTDDDDADPPSFVAMAPAASGMAVLVHGNAEVVIANSSGGVETLSGKAAAAWVDRIIEWPVASMVAVTSASTADQPAPRSQLHDGVVSAGGFVVVPSNVVSPAAATPSPVPSAAAEPVVVEPVVVDVESTEAMPLPAAPAAVGEAESAPEAVPVFDSVLLIPDAAPDDLVDDEPREPLPTADDSGHVHADADAVIVKGIRCKRDHFNTPKAAFCGVCGISMVQQTHQLVDGPRPPLGVIVLDDGVTFGLDADYVIGREPENDPDVMAGRVRGLTIEDPEGSVSRVHALIKLEDWDVVIIDRGSANGTRVSSPGTDSWMSVMPHEPVPIVPGTKVQLGSRMFTFDAHFRV